MIETEAERKKAGEKTNGERAHHGFSFKEIGEHVAEFIKAKIAYYKLTAIEGVAKAAANAVAGVALFLFGLFFITFLSVWGALFIGEKLGALHWGFLIVAGFYLLLCSLIVMMRKKWIAGPIINMLIKKFAGKSNEDGSRN